jgi:predicted transcriptional regulator
VPNLAHTATIAAAFLTNNPVPPSDIPRVLQLVHDALSALDRANAAESQAPALQPAVPVRKSITPDYLICLEDGLKMKSLKRHLRTSFNMTPEDYRAKWNLPADYPMVAPNYAARRSEMAKAIGLGRKRSAEG